MALTITNLSDAAKQAVIDRAKNAGVSSPADIRNILLAKLVDSPSGGAQLVTVADDAAFAALSNDDVKVGDFVVIESSVANAYVAEYPILFCGTEPGNLAHYAHTPKFDIATSWLVSFFKSGGSPVFNALSADSLSVGGTIDCYANITADGGDLKARDSLAGGPDLGIGNVIADYDVTAGRDVCAALNVKALSGDVLAYNSVTAEQGNVTATIGIVSGPTVTASTTLNIPMWTVGTLPAPTASGQLCVVVNCDNDHAASTRGSVFSDTAVGAAVYDCLLFSEDNGTTVNWLYA